jgi:DNA segregation ATPase FtsK/SpoIIIE, S-DNA-T family
MTYTYKLILQSGPDAGAEFPLEKPDLYLGRDAKNDVVINDSEVSRRHAHLVRQGDDYFYEDLGSTNGSFILGQKLSTSTLLRPGATITIGERVLINYVMTSTDASATVASTRKRQAPVSAPPVVLPPPVSVAPPVYQAPAAKVLEPVGQKSKSTKIILIIVAVILVFCIIPWIIMEVSDTYCNILGWFFNMLMPGSCPM